MKPKEKTMRKSSKTSKQKETDFEFLQGGKLAESVVLRQFAEVKRKWLAEIDDETAIRQQAGKYFNRIATSINDGESANEAQAISGLRRVTERLAKRKLTTPRKVRVLPDAWGSYSLKFTPPYTGLGTSVAGQISSVNGNPTISASGVDNLGQLSCSVDTDFNKPSGGTASNLMGVHFKPLFSEGTARISFDSEIAFSWYVNSIQNKVATSRAQGLIQLFQFDSAFVQPSLRRGAFIGWNEIAENELDFDFISETGPTWFLEAPVSSSHFYFVVISLTCTAGGAGWPGSLAGARAMVTVPSITVTVTANPVAQL
jgi:hypothetical protein